jgi:hypothetical protein
MLCCAGFFLALLQLVGPTDYDGRVTDCTAASDDGQRSESRYARGSSLAASKTTRCVFLVLAAISLLASTSYIAELHNPNENVRLYLTMAMVEEHTFAIDGPVARYGWVNDMARPPAKEDGVSRLYPAKAPATSYLCAPVYWAMRHLGPRMGLRVPVDASTEAIMPTAPADRAVTPAQKEAWFRASLLLLRFVVVALPDFLFFVFFFRWLRRWTEDDILRFAVVATSLLGTNYLAYSQELVSHAASAAAGFAAFALTLDELFWPSRARRPGRAFLVGLLAGLPVVFEYTGGTLTLALGFFAVLVFWRPRVMFPFALGAGLDAFGLLFYNWKCFGSPLTPPHKFLENQAYAQYHTHGVFGVGLPDLDVASAISFEPDYGIFATTPLLALALLLLPFGLLVAWGTRPVRRQVRRAAWACLAMILVLFATVSGITYWHGGWSVGPRFLGAAPPFLGFAALLALEQMARRWPRMRVPVRTLAAGLAPVGVIVMGLTGLETGTLPEESVRPFTDFTLPMIRAGFTPWTVASLFGINSYRVFWGIAAALVVAAWLPAFVPAGDGWKRLLPRAVLAIGLFAFALTPNLRPPTEPVVGNPHGPTAWFSSIWEPRGVDRISELRTTAERMVPQPPCTWAKIAALYRILYRDGEATRADQRAAGAPEKCGRGL